MDRILLNAGPSDRGWHRIADWRFCRRFYAYRHLIKIELSPADPLIKGILVHVGAAQHYAQKRCIQRGQDPYIYFNPAEGIALVAKQFGDKGAEHQEFCTNIVENYINAYARENMSIVMVEEPVAVNFKAADGRSFRFTQRWDLVWQDTNGRYWIVDNKTAAKQTNDTNIRYSLSGQFLGAQLIGAAKWGDEYGGIRFNFFGTRAPFSFSRNSPEASPFALSQFKASIIESELEIEAMVGRDPWTYPAVMHEQVCVTSYGPCAFMALCQHGKAELARWEDK